MAQVVNLGQFGPPRPSALSGLSEALQQRNKNQQVSRQQDLNERELEAKLAQQKIDRDDKTRQYLRSAYNNYWKMDDQKRKLFTENEQGKEFLKTTKKYLPELFDDVGNPLPVPQEKTAWQPSSMEEKVALEEAVGKMKAGLPLRDDQKAMIAQALDSAVMMGAIPEEQAMAAIKNLMGGVANKYQGALGASENPEDYARSLAQ